MNIRCFWPDLDFLKRDTTMSAKNGTVRQVGMQDRHLGYGAFHYVISGNKI